MIIHSEHLHCRRPRRGAPHFCIPEAAAKHEDEDDGTTCIHHASSCVRWCPGRCPWDPLGKQRRHMSTSRACPPSGMSRQHDTK
eukprot:1992225-Alexandrium_andersonii.AAC.1